MSFFGNKDMKESNNNLLIDKNKKKITKQRNEDAGSKKTSVNSSNGRKIKKIKKIKKKSKSQDKENHLNYSIEDVKNGIKLMELSEEDLDRGIEIITRTKKYMSSDERKMLIKLESILDLVKGIKKLNDVDLLEKEDESEFFRTMDEEDKKNMMIKEILEVFPERKKESLEKAMDIKKKIDIFAELFLPEGDEEGGFSLSSLADIGNLGSINNIKLLGSLLRGDDLEEEDSGDYVEASEYEAYNKTENWWF